MDAVSRPVIVNVGGDLAVDENRPGRTRATANPQRREEHQEHDDREQDHGAEETHLGLKSGEGYRRASLIRLAADGIPGHDELPLRPGLRPSL